MRRFDAITAWLAGLPVWKFVGVLFLAATLLPIGVLVFLPESWIGNDPELSLGVFEVIFSCVVVPMIETFVFQFLIIRIMSKWVSKCIPLQVLVSAAVFGALHYYHIAYVIYAFLVGIVLAWGFCAYYYKFGLGRAFWSVALVHGLRNALAFAALYLDI